jgi:DNA repair protein RecN (Recombination protein N)
VVDKLVAADDPAGGVTRSDIRQVQGKDRLAELARMLSGDDTAVAREHAAELLEAARADRAARH